MWFARNFCKQRVFLEQQNKKTLQELCGFTQYHNKMVLVANGTKQ